MAHYVTSSSDKSKKTAAILCAVGFLGVGGLHHFYVGRIGKGILYLFTGGLFIIGTIIDLISIATGNFRDNVGVPLRVSYPKERMGIPVAAGTAPVTSPASDSLFEIISFKLSGVSFNNDDGTSRQSILRKIKFNNPPFEHTAEFGLSKYEYEGKPALAVTANDIQIGNIASKDVASILDRWDRLECFTGCRVYGGGKTNEGEQKSFGCEVAMRFRKQVDA